MMGSIDEALKRISREGQVQSPLDELALELLEELVDSVLDEYPFVRYAYPTGDTVPSHLILGTLAGRTESGQKVMADGTIGEVVLKRCEGIRVHTKRERGWYFRVYVVPFEPGMKIRFWIHVEGKDGGDLPGSRRFILTDDKRAKEVTKETYERS